MNEQNRRTICDLTVMVDGKHLHICVIRIIDSLKYESFHIFQWSPMQPPPPPPIPVSIQACVTS